MAHGNLTPTRESSRAAYPRIRRRAHLNKSAAVESSGNIPMALADGSPPQLLSDKPRTNNTMPLGSWGPRAKWLARPTLPNQAGLRDRIALRSSVKESQQQAPCYCAWLTNWLWNIQQYKPE